jgi:hypothetical protein
MRLFSRFGVKNIFRNLAKPLDVDRAQMVLSGPITIKKISFREDQRTCG